MKEEYLLLGKMSILAPEQRFLEILTLIIMSLLGANAVVNKSFPDDVIIVGVPAKIIKNKE